MQEENEELVYYCRDCHSLHILVNELFHDEFWDGSYCGKCGSTNIAQCTIEEWLDEEERRRKIKEKIEWSK